MDQSGFVNRIVEYGRRFAIMMKDSNPDYLQKVEFLGGNSEYDAFAPKENVRIKKLGGGVRLALAQYRELAAFAQFASDLDDATRKELERGKIVTELMKQPQYQPLQVWESSNAENP